VSSAVAVFGDLRTHFVGWPVVLMKEWPGDREGGAFSSERTRFDGTVGGGVGKS
jgi:hypothetical protein